MSWDNAIQVLLGVRLSVGVAQDQLDGALDDEFTFHLEAAERELLLTGWTPDEAKREAIRRFGNKQQYKAQCTRIALEDQIMLQRLHAFATTVLAVGITVMGYQLYTVQQENGKAMASMSSTLTALQEGVNSDVERLRFDLSPVLRHQSTILDPASSTFEKLRALHELRLADGEGRSHEVVAAMLETARTSALPGVRAYIYRQLDEVPDLILKEALIESLANDPDPQVREAAAEMLGSFADDDQVQAVLRSAVVNDEARHVRHQARESWMRGIFGPDWDPNSVVSTLKAPLWWIRKDCVDLIKRVEEYSSRSSLIE